MVEEIEKQDVDHLSDSKTIQATWVNGVNTRSTQSDSLTEDLDNLDILNEVLVPLDLLSERLNRKNLIEAQQAELPDEWEQAMTLNDEQFDL